MSSRPRCRAAQSTRRRGGRWARSRTASPLSVSVVQRHADGKWYREQHARGAGIGGARERRARALRSGIRRTWVPFQSTPCAVLRTACDPTRHAHGLEAIRHAQVSCAHEKKNRRAGEVLEGGGRARGGQGAVEPPFCRTALLKDVVLSSNVPGNVPQLRQRWGDARSPQSGPVAYRKY